MIQLRVYADAVVPYLTLGNLGFTVVNRIFVWAQSNYALVTRYLGTRSIYSGYCVFDTDFCPIYSRNN